MHGGELAYAKDVFPVQQTPGKIFRRKEKFAASLSIFNLFTVEKMLSASITTQYNVVLDLFNQLNNWLKTSTTFEHNFFGKPALSISYSYRKSKGNMGSSCYHRRIILPI
jgi:hypothetical protein